jgi:hypothetical protein
MSAIVQEISTCVRTPESGNNAHVAHLSFSGNLFPDLWLIAEGADILDDVRVGGIGGPFAR